MSEDRNPTPPASEVINDLINADKVGDTVYSKHWLFTTLMKLIQEVERQSEGKEFLESDEVVDISEELQNELCELWDMSMNTDVALLLHEFKTIDLLTGVIAKTRAPRVTEIAVGTLGNMACNDSICVDMASKDKFIQLVLLLLENDDTPILVETTRLLYTCLCCERARTSWINAIKARDTVFINVQFILQSSTNNDLLKNAAELVDKLLDVDDEMCSMWASEELVMAVLEAMTQLGQKPGDALGTSLHILQLLSTSEKGVEVIVNECDRVMPPLKKFLESMCEDEIVAIGGCESWMGSALSVLHVIFSSVEAGVQLLFEDSRLFRCILKILEAMHYRLEDLKQEMRNLKEQDSLVDSETHESAHESVQKSEKTESSHENGSTDKKGSEDKLSPNSSSTELSICEGSDKKQESYTSTDQSSSSDLVSQNAKQESTDGIQASQHAEHQLLVVLLQVIKSFLEDILLAVCQENGEKEPEVLKYMSESCSRQRVLVMVDVLEDVDSLPINKMKASARRYKLDRLVNIIERRESTTS